MRPLPQRLGQTPRQAFELVYHPRCSGNGLAAWLAVPRHHDPALSPLIAIHGLDRKARVQAETFGPALAAARRIVVAPEFDETRWLDYDQIMAQGRPDLALLELIAGLRISMRWQPWAFELIGYCAGAQFAHHFALIHPQLITRLTLIPAKSVGCMNDTPVSCVSGSTDQAGAHDFTERQAYRDAGQVQTAPTQIEGNISREDFEVFRT
ncbi:MAG: hypothetical protein AAGH74_07845 [Pseudomonadota bacterium]